MVNAELKDVIKDIHGLQVRSHPDPSLLLILLRPLSTLRRVSRVGKDGALMGGRTNVC